MLDVEASVGLIQLGKYDKIIRKRRRIAEDYNDKLEIRSGWVLPPIVGATIRIQ